MRGFDELYPEIQMHVACNTDLVMGVACRAAARELFQESKVWRADLQTIKEKVGRDTYDLQLPEDTELIGVVAMLRGRTDLAPIGRVDLESTVGQAGTPTGFYRDELKIILDRSPTKEGSIIPTVELKPSADSVGVDNEYLADKYREYIVAGAVARLVAMPQKMWSSPSLYGVFRGEFERGIQMASREARKYNDGRPNLVEYPYSVRDFASVSRRGSRGRY